jgi:CHAT domain-containing protein
LTLKEIQQQVLDDNSLLLEYFLGDERSYLWAVSREEISSYELAGRAEIEELAQNVYGLLKANQSVLNETNEPRQARVGVAAEQLASKIANLSRLLLAPVAPKLGTKRLLVVPDGTLQYIPFQVLIKPADANASGSTLGVTSAEPRPLVADHEIVNEPSASALALLLSGTTKRKRAANTVAVLADPVFEADDPRIGAAAEPKRVVQQSRVQETELQRSLRDVSLPGEGGQIPRLLASRDEADAIMSAAPWWSGFRAVGFDASRKTAMSSDLSNYRIVHFATHSLLNNEHPELSGVVLSLVDQKGSPQDGFLRLHDIYNLKLPVDLVVLSACNTGLGKDVKGEGLIGLTRGFMFAGAKGVVASLWKVDDDATAELMKHFYEGMLRKGLTPSAALREAQLTMRRQKRWQAPYYWAAFVIQGQYNQNEIMGRRSPIAITAAAAFAAAVCLAAFFFLKRRRRKFFR